MHAALVVKEMVDGHSCIQHVCMFIISILLLFHKIGILNTHTHVCIYIYIFSGLIQEYVHEGHTLNCKNSVVAS